MFVSRRQVSSEMHAGLNSTHTKDIVTPCHIYGLVIVHSPQFPFAMAT